jgi:eukaryotic-like serine/threonine-protein kinase
MQTPLSNGTPMKRPQGRHPRANDLVGRYRLDRETRRSDLGVVYDATELSTERRVAVEVATKLDDPEARARFTRDAMMAQRLEGEHVLCVLDVGALPDGVPYLVREHAVATLADEIAARHEIPIEEAVGWTLEACEALAEAHAIGMAHGDVRAENCWLARGRDGSPIVKVAWTSHAKADAVAKEDIARDIAGLGGVLRALVSGTTTADDADGAPTLPNGVAHVVARASGQGDERYYAHVGELASDLAPFGPPDHPSVRTTSFLLSRAGIARTSSPRTISTPTPALPTSVAASNEAHPDGWNERAHDGRRWGSAPPGGARKGGLAMLAAVLLGVAAFGAYALYRSGNAPWSTDTSLAGDDAAEIPREQTLARAEAANDASLLHWSRALPPMDAPAEQDGTRPADGAAGTAGGAGAVDGTGAGAADEPGYEAPATPKDTGPADPGQKAKSAPRGAPGEAPTDPRGVQPPQTAAEAAQRGDRPGRPLDGPTPSTPVSPGGEKTPRPLAPTAPAETADPLE